MAHAPDRCPRCGEEERLGTWCGACGAQLEDMEAAAEGSRRASVRRVVVAVLLVVLIAAAVLGLAVTGVYDPFDLGL